MKPNPNYRGKWYAPMIDNPDYKGEWAPRLIPNPGYFEDNEPVKSLEKIVSRFVSDVLRVLNSFVQGGVGIELWTMTEDILFDNLYVGHSPEDAKKLAEQTFEVKKKIEQEANKAQQAAEEEEEKGTVTSLKDDPVGFVRGKVLEFIELAKIDPMFAARVMPEVAGGLGLVALFFVGALFSLLFGGSSSKPSAVSLHSFSCQFVLTSPPPAIQED